MSSLDLYILCRDRPEMAVRAIESALSNHLSFVSIFISDNSVSDDIYQLSKNYPSCTYIRRSPCLKSIFEHYKVIISESSSEYICFLHDDDILSSNYLERLVYFLDSDLTISAVACNGIPIYPNLSLGPSMLNEYSLIAINNPVTLLQFYLNPRFSSNAPFSSYIFRQKYLKNNLINESEGGIHSDVIFLCKLLAFGKILWIPTVYIFIGTHPYRYSSRESLADRRLLLQYLYNSYLSLDSPDALIYRYSSWLRQIYFDFRQNGFSFILTRRFRSFCVMQFSMLFKPSYHLSIFFRLYRFFTSLRLRLFPRYYV